MKPHREVKSLEKLFPSAIRNAVAMKGVAFSRLVLSSPTTRTFFPVKERSTTEAVGRRRDNLRPYMQVST